MSINRAPSICDAAVSRNPARVLPAGLQDSVGVPRNITHPPAQEKLKSGLGGTRLSMGLRGSHSVVTVTPSNGANVIGASSAPFRCL